MALSVVESNNMGNKDLQLIEENIPLHNDCATNLQSTGDSSTLKHPLENTWTLWYLENDRTKSWEELQNEITSFDTVEDFWSLCNHIKSASEIKIGSDYSLFKKGIRPMWEDNANKKGGRWVITLERKQHKILDNIWLDVLLSLIGEAFDNSTEICGAVLNVRSKFDKISVWTANGKNEEGIMEIGRKLKENLHLDSYGIIIQYELHKDTMVKSGAGIKSIYSI
ncbi:eukaryotic translation initiation factor 4E1 [Condylostylus longicornis]|uniref:eukaryotic translation initiation factor 4E1 n=1 Tax=Condylostylus longicornis TaxID=2530218 RepID=UPI00244DE8D5|nr:eukaryotic translation initiation factor 4E1 [Condylostylus longicornis]